MRARTRAGWIVGILAVSGAWPIAVMSSDRMAPLWSEPADLSSRDVFYGPGGRDRAPQPGANYRFVSADTTGHSRGYHVVGPDGRKWKVKVGDEVGSEIAVSRVLWAIGYRQPAMYLLDDWRLIGGPSVRPGPARFRLASDHTTEGSWALDRNPFTGTRELRGLIALDILLNNWDLAPSNNRIYRVKTAGQRTETWYVEQDVGGSLGKSRLPLGTRNRIEDFERQGFVLGVDKGTVVFDYHGRHKNLLKDITPGDVAWVCGLLARLSDRQLDDAFRAAGYADDVRDRYLRKIKEKIRQGLALETTAAEMR